MEKSEIKKEPSGSFFMEIRRLGEVRGLRSEVFGLKSSTLPVSLPLRDLSLFENAKEDTYDMS